MDPIEAAAQLAADFQLPLHVDACFGGFMLPWLEKIGDEIPVFDFRCPGVTSMSVGGAANLSVCPYKHTRARSLSSLSSLSLSASYPFSDTQADIHKYGWGPKGASVVLFRHNAIRRNAVRPPAQLHIVVLL